MISSVSIGSRVIQADSRPRQPERVYFTVRIRCTLSLTLSILAYLLLSQKCFNPKPFTVNSSTCALVR